MGYCNWGVPAQAMSYQMKLIKHMNLNHEDKVKDYLVAGFDNFNPGDFLDHPCMSVIKDAANWLMSKGWKVGVYDWRGEKGLQFTCISPNNEWYRSHYKY